MARALTSKAVENLRPGPARREIADRTPLLAWFKDAFATRAYLRTVIDDLSQALGEDQDAHVSHRRH